MEKYGKQCHSLCVIHYGNPPEKVRVLRFQSLIMGLLWVLSICALRLLQGGRKPIIRLVVPLEPLVVPSSCKMRP